MIIALFRCFEYFHAFPANMSLTTCTIHVVASTILENSSLTSRTLPHSHLVHGGLVVVLVFPLLTSVVGMTLIALQTLDLTADFTVDFAIFFDLFLVKHIFAVLASQILVLMYL